MRSILTSSTASAACASTAAWGLGPVLAAHGHPLVRTLKRVALGAFLLAAGFGSGAARAQTEIDPGLGSISTLAAAFAAGDAEAAVSQFTTYPVVVDLRGRGLALRVFVGREQVHWWARSMIDRGERFGPARVAIVRGGHVSWTALSTPGVLSAVDMETDVDAVMDGQYIASLRLVPTIAAARRLHEGSISASNATGPVFDPARAGEVLVAIACFSIGVACRGAFRLVRQRGWRRRAA